MYAESCLRDIALCTEGLSFIVPQTHFQSALLSASPYLVILQTVNLSLHKSYEAGYIAALQALESNVRMFTQSVNL